MSVIELQNIDKFYGHDVSRVEALKDVNFATDRGEVTLIIGPSGAGKSTFLTIAGGLQGPTNGTVKIEGHEVGAMNNRQREAIRLTKVGFVLQAYNLVPYLTVRDQFPLVDKVKKTGNLSRQELTGLLDRLGIAALMDKYPNELSGGQQQRVAIARALYANPQYVLADEPTAALDSARVDEVGQLFSDLARTQRKSVIIVTHDLRLLKYADKVYEIMDGQMHEKKRPAKEQGPTTAFG